MVGNPKSKVQIADDEGHGLITYPQAARYLAISQRSLWQLVDEGQIPVVRFREGGAVRFSRAVLDAWIEKKLAESTAGEPVGRPAESAPRRPSRRS